jgi:protein-tyrosine-phosphatase
MKIHFICRGNVLRSLVAETYVKSLKLKDVECISSGVKVDLYDSTERGYFQNTLGLLERHGIARYAKQISHQLTQERVDSADVTVCVNQRAFDEAALIVTLPENTIIWDIVDIGEGRRAINKDVLSIRMSYEDEIYTEIKVRVDELVAHVR